MSTIKIKPPIGAFGSDNEAKRVTLALLDQYRQDGYFYAGSNAVEGTFTFSTDPDEAVPHPVFPDLFIRVKKVHPDAVIPKYAMSGDAGLDLVSTEEHTIEVGKTSIVGTGISIEIPPGYAGFVLPRSGLAAKSAITVVNAPELIDSGYRGEVKVILTKLNKHGDLGHHRIGPGTRIAQLLILPYPTVALVEATDLSDSDRGLGGFGSTGITSAP